MKHLVKSTSHWLVLLLITDLVFVFLTWLLRPEAVGSISVFLLLFTLMITAVGFWLERRRRMKISEAVERFLKLPEDANKAALVEAAGEPWRDAVERIAAVLNGQAEQINEKTMELTAYREYLEAWVHEIKTPLSLSALVLYNHREEMSPYVFGRMQYVQNLLNEDAERILYYARLQAEHTDFRFTRVRLDDCVREVLADYRPMAVERGITVQTELEPLTVVTDQRVLRFMLTQLLSNAMKYADETLGRVSVSVWQEGDRVVLAVRDNGSGVPPEDAPFLFDKGFTGSHPERQKATGMGLYLVKKYARSLCVEVALEPGSTSGKGFGIALRFSL